MAERTKQRNSLGTAVNATSVGYALVTGLLAWIVPGLVAHDPWKPDEAYTFGLVYHVLQGGSWIVPKVPATRTTRSAIRATLSTWTIAATDRPKKS